jgi:site-specific recombinase XerD
MTMLIFGFRLEAMPSCNNPVFMPEPTNPSTPCVPDPSIRMALASFGPITATSVYNGSPSGPELGFLKLSMLAPIAFDASRNLRLASLKTFSLFLTTKDVLRAGEYQRIMALPLKKAPHKVIEYLEVDEITAIIGDFNHENRNGQRDHVLLNLLYNTGARVQEICDLTVSSITFGKLPVVTLVGKGNKTRMVPIWQDTAKLLTDYLHENQLLDQPDAKLFLNACGQPLGRFGVRYIIKKRVELASKKHPALKSKSIGPHTFRHSIATHLLQAGVDLSIIRSWLGHVNLQTTHAYVEIDMEMKRKVLNAYSPSSESKSLKSVLDKNKDVLAWLESI